MNVRIINQILISEVAFEKEKEHSISKQTISKYLKRPIVSRRPKYVKTVEAQCPPVGVVWCLMVKVMDSWLSCHEFEPSTAEDPPCRGGRCTLNMSKFKRPTVGEEWKLGGGMLAHRGLPHHLTMVQNSEIRHHINPRVGL
ncbi:hypothetical protein TNCV_4261941 [Trichonephila clavipes]|nr:hypothetical protein TNCV_4261941 [Trichonephila clavipes]